MVDLHCHILHNIDDGSDSLAESVALCRQAVYNDIDTVVLTPHLSDVMNVEDFLESRDKRIEELRAELVKEEIELELIPGAEVYVNDDIFYAPSLKGAAIGNTNFILVEFDFNGLGLNRLARYLNEFLDRDMRPIVAHPERYSYLQRDYDLVNYLSRCGVLFQVNASSLAGYGTRSDYELARKLVKHSIASFIATDAHSMSSRSNDLDNLIDRFPSDISDTCLHYMLETAPRHVINGEEPPQIYRTPLVNNTWKR